ncbi:hypothetical protein VE26_11735 [Devosia chinhatensis]|uniref:Autotransporter domain-containing protein n=1 Tax=Devosia chinhatensis TaxID=429727 RepID=A0A0F5FFR0_9HYPH|nr:hypothetical protein VE26_11735 [Devosia chinhatensis]
MGIAVLSAVLQVAALSSPLADSVIVTDTSGLQAAVDATITSGQPDTITAQGGGTFVAGPDWILPGAGDFVSLTFNTSPFQVGNPDGDATLTLLSGSILTLDTTSGTSAGRIELGNGSGSSGTLNISGGTLQVNLADTSTAPGTSIGRIWVGGGATNTTGGTGSLNITAGELLYVANAGSLNYGGLAVGRGNGVTGAITQSGGVVRFSSAGSLDLGTQGGSGTYTLSGDGVFDAGSGGMTAYIGSRTSGGGGTGTAATGTLIVSDNAQFSMTTGSFAGGQLYVGDSKGVGVIRQHGAGSSVTLGLQFPISFGSDVSNYGTGGSGTYELSAGTLSVQNVGGSGQIVFGAAAGGTGTFDISGGSATVATPLLLASVTGSTGTLNLTGGSLTLSGSSYLSFGSGSGTVNLNGGTLTVGGTDGIRGTGTFTFGGGTLAVGSNLTTSNAMTIGSGRTAFIDTSGNSATLSGVLSGSGALNKTGSGTLILSGTNTYTGGTTIAGGTLQIAANSGLGGIGSLTLSGGTLAVTGTFTTSRVTTLSGSGGAFAPASGATLTWNGKISGSGGLTMSGAGTLVLGGVNDYTGGTTINSGTVSINAESRLGNTSGVLTMAGGTLVTSSITIARAISLTGAATISPSGTTTISSGMTGSGGLTKSGAGTLILTGANTHSGGTTISSGTLQIGNAGATGSLTGNVTNNAMLTFSRSDALTFGGTISGSGVVSKVGGGTLTLSGNNTYSGGTTVSAGTLAVSADANLGDTSGSLTISGTSTSLATTASFSSGRAVNLANGFIRPAAGTTLTLSGVLSGTLLRMGGGGTLILSGSNNYTGGTTISNGTLEVSAETNLGTGTAISFTNGTLATTGTFSSARTVFLNGAGTFAPSAGTTLTLSGVISGSEALTQAGAGTLVLSGTNTNTGGTTVSAGTLDVTGSLVGTVDVRDGATLKGSGSIAGVVTVRDGGSLSGTQGAGLTMGGLTLSSGSGLNITLGASAAGGVFTVNGDLTLDGTLNVSKGTDFGAGVYSIIGYTGTLTNNGLALTSLGSGFTGLVQTSQSGIVNLVVDGSDSSIQFWNGVTTEPTQAVEGGDGTWTAGLDNTNWTTMSGTIPLAAQGGFAIFQGTAGTVSVDNDAGDVTATGLQFVTSGYSVTGDALTFTGADPATIRVGDGTAASATMVATISSMLAGTAGIEKTDYGTLVLSGANAYSGGTTISGGTLKIGADSALGATGGGLTIATGVLATTASFTSSRSVSLTGNAAIDTADATTLTLAGVISGDGSLTKAGNGTLILTGNNSFSGTTTISAGTLQIGNGGTTGSLSGNIINNANLVYSRSDAYTVPGSITGSGMLTLSGGGTATFTSSVAADVTLEHTKAVLAQGSSSAVEFVVGNGGVLGGSATIGGLVVNAGGTVAPGYSPGTLTVNGPVTFNTGSVYSVDVMPDGRHDRIIASGDVTISSGARVEIVAGGGLYDRNSRLTILTTTGNRSGTFGGVVSNLAFLLPTLRYDDKNVFLDLVYSGTSIATYAQTRNQASVATAIQALGGGNALFDAMTRLSEDAVAPALDLLSGEIYPSINSLIGQQGSNLRQTIGARLDQDGSGALASAAGSTGPATVSLGQASSSSVWVQGYGGWDQIRGNGNASPLSSTVGGIFVGVDTAITDSLRAGVVGGYSSAQLKVDERSSFGTMASVDLGAYLDAQFGALGLRGGAAYGWHDIDVERRIDFPGFSDQQSAGYGLNALQIFGEAGFRLDFDGYELEPFGGLAYVNVSSGSAIESGGGAAGLSVDIAGQQTVYTTLGTRFATTIDLDGATLTPSLTVGWQHVVGDTAPSATMQSGSNQFTIEGVPAAKDMLILGTGLSLGFSDGLSLDVNYAGRFAEGASQNAVTARLRGEF